MAESNFKIAVDFWKEKRERDKKNYEFIFTQTDSFVSWIIGFAFTGLLLIISNFLPLRVNLNSSAKPIIIFLFLTILFGITFRYVSFLMMLMEKKLDDYFTGVFSDTYFKPIEPYAGVDEETYEGILKRLKEDFEESIYYPINFTKEQKKADTPNLIQHYKNLCAHSKDEIQVGWKFIAEVFQEAYKEDASKTMKSAEQLLKKNKIGYNLKRWQRWRSFLYTLCVGCFLIAIIIVCVYMLFFTP